MDGNLFPQTERWRRLYAYWRALPHDLSQLDADPVTDMPALAQHMIIIDVLDSGYRYRHFGSDIARRINADLTGKTPGGSSLVEPLKLGWHQLLGSVVRLRKPRLIMITGESDNQNYLLVLPMADTGGTVRRLLAGVFIDENAGSKIIIRGWRKIPLDENPPAA